MKLVSTYNNGNIFGACMLMLAPIYMWFEKRSLFTCMFILAIVLTLSRTAWFGLVVVFALLFIFNRMRVHRSVLVLYAIGGIIVIATVLMPLMGWGNDRILDSDLGGRSAQFSAIDGSLFGPPTPFQTIREMLYVGFLVNFGVVGGALAMFAVLFFPILWGATRLKRLSPMQFSAWLGVITYASVAFFDAASGLIPVLALFLLVCCLLYQARQFQSTKSPSPGLFRAAPRPGSASRDTPRR